MVDAGNVSVQVQLSLDQLRKDIAAAGTLIKTQLKPAEAPIALKGIAEQARAFQEAVSEASLYTQALSQVGQQLSQTGAQINSFTQQAVAAAIAFDDARAKVATLSSDADGLAASMQSLSAELNYQVSSTDLLNASYDVLSSGFSDAADVTGILQASALGAQGGFSSIGVVADATTTVLNSFNLKAEEAAHIVDVLAQTQDLGKITIDQYASGVGQAASIVATAGVSFEEFSAAIASATAKGVPASSAISGTRQAIVNLLKPTAEAQKLLEQFGIQNSTAALRSEGLVGILQRLRDQGATTDQLSKIFSDVDALATVATIAGDNLGGFVENIDRMNNANGKASNSAAEVADSFSGQYTAALNQANEALVSLGQGVTEALVPLLKALTFLLSNFNALPAPIKNAVGLMIALTGGVITLGGAMASVAAVLPVVTAGLASVGIGGAAAATSITAVGTAIAPTQAGLLLLATNGNLAGAGMTAAAVGTGKFSLALTPLAPLLAVVAAGIGLISLVSLTNELRDANVEIDAVMQTVGTTGENAIAAAERTALATKTLTEARESGRALTQQELADAEKQLQMNDLRLSQLRDDLRVAEALPAANEAQRNSKEALIASTQRSIDVLESETGKLRELTTETNTASAAVDRFADNQARQAQVAETTRAEAQLAIAEQVAAGVITEEQAREENLRAEQEYLDRKLQLNEDNLERLRQARNNADGAEALAAANQAVFDAEQESGKIRLEIAQNLADARIAEEKRATDEIKRLIGEVDDRAQQQTTQVKVQQAGGRLSEDQAQTQIAAIQRSAIAEQIGLIQQRLQVVRAGSEEEKALAGQLADLQERAADQELARQKQVAEEQLANLERANRQAEAAVAASQTARVAAVRQAQLQGVTSAEEADRQIQAIDRESSAQYLALKQEELAQVQSLREQGLISEEEAGNRTIELNQAIADANLTAINSEIQAQQALRQAKLDALGEELAIAQTSSQARVGANQLALNSIAQQNSLLDAQSGLLQAQAGLYQQRLQFALADAEERGNTVAAERLRRQIIAEQIAAQEAQFAIEQQQLATKQEQLRLETEIQQLQADIAIQEAQNAVAEATLNGESQSRIDGLRQIVELRERERAAIDAIAAAQGRSLALEQQTLAAQQQTAREASARAQAAENESRLTAAGSGSGASAGSSGGSGVGGSSGGASGSTTSFTRYMGSDAIESQRRADQGIRSALGSAGDARLNLLQAGAGAGQLAGNSDFLRALDQMGQSQLGDLAAQIQSGAINRTSAYAAANRAVVGGRDPIEAIAALSSRIDNLANTAAQPRSVTVQTPDPIRDTGRIMNDFSRQSMRRLGR